MYYTAQVQGADPRSIMTLTGGEEGGGCPQVPEGSVEPWSCALDVSARQAEQ